MSLGFVWTLVIDVGVFGDKKINDSQTAMWWNMTDLEGGQSWFGGGISLDVATDLYVIRNDSLTALSYRDEVLDPIVRAFAGVPLAMTSF